MTRAVCSTRERQHGADELASTKAFSGLYVNMVAAGEAGGILDTILMRLATFLEKNDALVRKVKGAMTYPAVIMGVAGLAIVVLLLKVIPVFKDMFGSVGMELPVPTRIVIGLSNFLTSYWWALLAGIVATVLGLRAWYKTPGGQLAIDAFLLKTPVMGDLLRKSAVSRFTRTLGTLISSGVSILDGLEITAKTAGNAAAPTLSWRAGDIAAATRSRALKAASPPM